MRAFHKIRMISLFLAVAMLISMIPPFELHVKAANTYTFDDGPVVITPTAQPPDTAAGTTYQDGDTIIIKQGVFSVTVVDVDVNIIFGEYNTADPTNNTGVTINRADNGTTSNNHIIVNNNASNGKATNQQLYEAGVELAEYDSKWKISNNQYYVPTAPFWIMGDANVNAIFYGRCEFRAGTNGVRVTKSGNSYTIKAEATTGSNRGGYAGIQVDGNASLTITNADNLTAVGAYCKDNPALSAQSGPSDQTLGGGAGIGGGVSYAPQPVNTKDNKGVAIYTQGTPGNITILNGTITAYGGHCAAGIGGGLNSAATTGAIKLLGGTITAYGGCWAAGIGEGDSVNGATSNMFTTGDGYEIIIGGDLNRSLTVKAYGGYCASGIGTTDEITEGSEKRSLLSITIYSGTINAFSGKGEKTVAAIGAGDATDMQDNTITIYSNAYVTAASYSWYSICNFGVNDKAIPMVNLDPNSYLYLLRFDKIVSENRTFNLYPVKHTAEGDPILVNATTDEVVTNSLTDKIFYAHDLDTGKYYRVDQDGNYLDQNGNISTQKISVEASAIGKNLTYYFLYGEGNIIRTYTVPGDYKAIALTLPDPSEYGGTYVLEAPKAGEKSKTLFAAIEKYSPGVGSGLLVEQSPHNNHMLYNSDKGEFEEVPNLIEDAVAKPFTDLCITHTARQKDAVAGFVQYELDSENNLIEYSPSTFVYTVYVTRTNPTFYLSFTYDADIQYQVQGGKTTPISSSVASITIDDKEVHVLAGDITIDTLEVHQNNPTLPNRQEYALGQNMPHVYKFELHDGLEKADLWIRKNDVAFLGTSPYIVYRIEIIVKEDHGINLTDLTKTYDGTPVTPSYSNFAEEVIGFHYTVTDHPDTIVNSELVTDNIGGTIQLIPPGNGITFGGTEEGEAPEVLYIEATMKRDDSVILIKTDIYHKHWINFGEDGQVLPDPIEEKHHRIIYTEINIWSGHVETYGETGAIIGHYEWEIDVGHVLNTITDASGTYKQAYAYVTLIDNYRITETVNVNNNTNTRDGTDTDTENGSDTESGSGTEGTPGNGSSGFIGREYPVWSVTVDVKGTSFTGDIRTEKINGLVEEANQEFQNPEITYYQRKDFTYDRNDIKINTDIKVTLNGTIEKNYNVTTGGEEIAIKGHFDFEARMADGSNVISLPLTLQADQFIFYIDNQGCGGEGIKCGHDTLLSGPPTDVGHYLVMVSVNETAFDVYGVKAFEITQAPLTITAIEDYITYVNAETDWQTSLVPKNISQAGNIYYSGLFGDDTVTLNPAITYFYNKTSIGYDAKKITLKLPDGQSWLPVAETDSSGSDQAVYPDENRNYYIVTDSQDGENIVKVPGEIVYNVTVSVFRKTEDGPWRKYWPDVEGEPLKWDENSGSNGIFTKPAEGETRIDYQSPNNISHKTAVTLRSVNMGESEARYSVDLVFGDMYFTYSKSVWNVNTYEYISPNNNGTWSGNNGVNNKIQITNHSNCDISFEIKANLDTFYGQGIKASISEVPNAAGVQDSVTGNIPYDSSKVPSVMNNQASLEVALLNEEDLPEEAEPSDGTNLLEGAGLLSGVDLLEGAVLYSEESLKKDANLLNGAAQSTEPWVVVYYLYLTGIPQTPAPVGGNGTGTILVTLTPKASANADS